MRLMDDADVVQLHCPLPEAPLIAGLARMRRKPVVMTHHGDLVMPAGAWNGLIERSGFVIATNTARICSALTSYSADYAKASPVLRPFLSKVTSIHPPVYIPEPCPSDVEALRGELGLGTSRVVGFAGRWVHEKGFDVLLAAIPELVRAYPDVRFVYAGAPPVYEDFMDRCKPAIEAAGDRLVMAGLIVDRRRMAAFYGLSSVFALPSRSDMFALVQAEALLCGTPVVASDIPGARAAVLETGMGMLARPNDPAALARGIATVLSQPERFRPERTRVEAKYSPSGAAEAHEELFAKVCGAAAR
jgi:glycosyltransferase involved in cell wall biosynthesis